MENIEAKNISIAWGVLSFFIPLVGIILYFAWRNDETKLKVRDRTLIPALVGVAFNVMNTIRIIGTL